MTITYLSTLEQVVSDAYFNDSTKLTELREQIVNDISQFLTKSVILNCTTIIKIQDIN